MMRKMHKKGGFILEALNLLRIFAGTLWEPDHVRDGYLPSDEHTACGAPTEDRPDRGRCPSSRPRSGDLGTDRWQRTAVARHRRQRRCQESRARRSLSRLLEGLC